MGFGAPLIRAIYSKALGLPWKDSFKGSARAEGWCKAFVQALVLYGVGDTVDDINPALP